MGQGKKRYDQNTRITNETGNVSESEKSLRSLGSLGTRNEERRGRSYTRRLSWSTPTSFSRVGVGSRMSRVWETQGRHPGGETGHGTGSRREWKCVEEDEPEVGGRGEDTPGGTVTSEYGTRNLVKRSNGVESLVLKLETGHGGRSGVEGRRDRI